MKVEPNILINDALLYAKSSVSLLEGYIDGRLDLSEMTLGNIERGLRDAADLVGQLQEKLSEDQEGPQ